MAEGGENHSELQFLTHGAASSTFESNAVQVRKRRKTEASLAPPHSPHGYSSLVCNVTPQLPVTGQNKVCPLLRLCSQASDRMYTFIHSSARYSASFRGAWCVLGPGGSRRVDRGEATQSLRLGTHCQLGQVIPESLHLLCHQCECATVIVSVCTFMCVREGVSWLGRAL